MRIDRTRDGGALGRLNQFREERGLPKLDKNGKPIKAKAKTKTKSKAKKPAAQAKPLRKIGEGGLKGRQHWFQSNFGNRG